VVLRLYHLQRAQCSAAPFSSNLTEDLPRRQDFYLPDFEVRVSNSNSHFEIPDPA